MMPEAHVMVSYHGGGGGGKWSTHSLPRRIVEIENADTKLRARSCTLERI